MGCISVKLITVVSGLPRSGTSMMMQALKAGGMLLLTDNVRRPDLDNQCGYFEYEPVKKIAERSEWLEEATGKAVKIIYALLWHLPPGYKYKIIFMERKTEEVLASQKKMLLHRNKPAKDISDEKMLELYSPAVAKIKNWLKKQPNIEIFYANYNRILKKPLEHADKINSFLGLKLNTMAMAKVVDSSFYRQRK